MASDDQPDGPPFPYFIDPEKAAEMARLQQQNRIITLAMGGHLPECTDFGPVQSILDLGCGPGDWGLDLAHAYPRITIIGVDVSQRMLAYANAQRLSNAKFRYMDITQPLTFPDAHFDIINARLIASAVPKTAWPGLLQECKRLLRPGGLLRLAEYERPITNSPACERYNTFITQAFYRAGHSFSFDDHHTGITPLLPNFLEEAGCDHLQKRVVLLDFSARAPAHISIFENLRMGYLLVQPYLLKWNVASEAELVTVYNQALDEMQDAGFRGLIFMLVAWGTRSSS